MNSKENKAMASKKDKFVAAFESDGFIANLTNPCQTIWRFADDNDGAEYNFGRFFRTVKTREEAVKMTSNRSSYMGRKAHQWYLVVKDTANGFE